MRREEGIDQRIQFRIRQDASFGSSVVCGLGHRYSPQEGDSYDCTPGEQGCQFLAGSQ